jgi:hypothetical protein
LRKSPPFAKGSCEKIEIFPLTLPSPARGEGKYIEIQEEIPSPSRGEGQGFGPELSRTVGVKMGFFHTFGEGKGGGEMAMPFGFEMTCK